MRAKGQGGHIARWGDLMTPCWCEREAKPIPAAMVARGETWACDSLCRSMYLRRLERERLRRVKLRHRRRLVAT